jgi:chemotaxis protein MotA
VSPARTTPGRPRRLDITTVFGLLFSVGLIIAGHVLEGGRAQSLWQAAAAVIVFGGTFGAVLVSFSLAEVKQAVGALKHVFLEDRRSNDDMLATISRLATKARKEGIMRLEDDAERVDDQFLRRGLALAVDGATPATVRTMLEGESFSRHDAEEAPARVFESAGGYAPTMGILGAVMGLIHVMENLSEPGKLGAGIAVAFVATVYGVGSANLIFLPIGTKLRARAARNARRREVLLEGILAIQEGLNPRLIDQKLRGLLAADEVKPQQRLRGRAA